MYARIANGGSTLGSVPAELFCPLGGSFVVHFFAESNGLRCGPSAIVWLTNASPSNCRPDDQEYWHETDHWRACIYYTVQRTYDASVSGLVARVRVSDVRLYMIDGADKLNSSIVTAPEQHRLMLLLRWGESVKREFFAWRPHKMRNDYQRNVRHYTWRFDGNGGGGGGNESTSSSSSSIDGERTRDRLLLETRVSSKVFFSPRVAAGAVSVDYSPDTEDQWRECAPLNPLILEDLGYGSRATLDMQLFNLRPDGNILQTQMTLTATELTDIVLRQRRRRRGKWSNHLRRRSRCLAVSAESDSNSAGSSEDEDQEKDAWNQWERSNGPLRLRVYFTSGWTIRRIELRVEHYPETLCADGMGNVVQEGIPRTV